MCFTPKENFSKFVTIRIGIHLNLNIILMKKITLIIAFLSLILCVKAQVTDIDVTPKVTAVTVYMNGAQITHTSDVTLNKGDYNIVFAGISPDIDNKSIQVTANNEVKISSVTYITDFIESKTVSKSVQKLKDSLKLLTKKLLSIENQLNVFDNEKELIIKNNDLKGETNGIQVSELQKAADFFRLRLNEINTQTEKLNEQKDILNEQYTNINNQLSLLNLKQNQPVYKISVIANVKSATTCPFIIKYLTSGAGWAAFYDIRAINSSSPIQLDYKANIYNNCGIDWNDVKLTLSTADPSSSVERPRLKTWGLNYGDDNNNDINYEGKLNTYGAKSNDTSKIKNGTQQFKNQYSKIEVSELTVEFEIKTKYTIPSNNNIYSVDIQTQELLATYKYIAVPKMDNNAFLIANVTGWEKLNLIEGNANIFYAGTYIGQSYLDTRYSNDTLEVSLGRDKKIAITRTKKEDLSEKSLFGSERKEKLTYNITIRNNNNAPIDIEVQDQVPVSQESEIKVDVIESSGETPDPSSGKLVYKLKLAPSETKLITISFTVQYPKNKKVKLRKSRTTVTPRFF